LEVNVSADYTDDFPSVRDDGIIDFQGNGEPSITYRGEISVVHGDHSTPILTGYTSGDHSVWQMYDPEKDIDMAIQEEIKRRKVFLKFKR